MALVTRCCGEEFRETNFEAIRAALSTPVAFDGRNLYEPAVMAAFGLECTMKLFLYAGARPCLTPSPSCRNARASLPPKIEPGSQRSCSLLSKAILNQKSMPPGTKNFANASQRSRAALSSWFLLTKYSQEFVAHCGEAGTCSRPSLSSLRSPRSRASLPTGAGENVMSNQVAEGLVPAAPTPRTARVSS